MTTQGNWPKPQYLAALHHGRYAAQNGCKQGDNPYQRSDYRKWWEAGRTERLETMEERIIHDSYH